MLIFLQESQFIASLHMPVWINSKLYMETKILICFYNAGTQDWKTEDMISFHKINIHQMSFPLKYHWHITGKIKYSVQIWLQWYF